MKFTDKLDALMKQRGITRGRLAEETKIPYNTIVGFYTKGYHNIKLTNLRKLADYFGVSLDALGNDDISIDEINESRELDDLNEKYSALSLKGKDLVKNMIDGILDIEDEVSEDTAERPAKKLEFIREYVTPAAAGYASPAEGEDYNLIVRDDSVPGAADFAVRIDGDSMEPYIMDGSRVYVTRTNELNDGDVGIFFVDGDMKCKQFCEDSFGNIYLFSLNRERSDADVVIPNTSGITVFCFGRVIMKRKAPLPGGIR